MATRTARVRLDELLVSQGHAPSRHQAKALILAGRVEVPSGATAKPGLLVDPDATLKVAPAPSYVSRGGQKLAHGLDQLGVNPAGRICADVGASTGGFTDCLLQRGATRVYAIDVGYGQLDWRLRTDPRVVVLERTNARYLESLPEPVSLVVVDASFISLRNLLPAIRRFSTPDADVVALVKPQFEAGRSQVGKGGVVRDERVHREVLESLRSWLTAHGAQLRGLAVSPIRGPAGNVEFLAHVQFGPVQSEAPANMIERVLQEARRLGEQREDTQAVTDD